jgi:hypothetical protein
MMNPSNQIPPTQSPESSINMLVIVGGFLIIIGLFLPWATEFELSGVEEIWTGFQLTTLFSFGLLAFACAIIMAAFLENPKMSFIFALLCLIFFLLYRPLFWLFFFCACATTFSIGGIGLFLSILGTFLAVGGSAFQMWSEKNPR